MADITRMAPAAQRQYLGDLKRSDPSAYQQTRDNHAADSQRQNQMDGMVDQVAGAAIGTLRVGSDIVTCGASENLMAAGRDGGKGDYLAATEDVGMAAAGVLVSACTMDAAGVTRIGKTPGGGAPPEPTPAVQEVEQRPVPPGAPSSGRQPTGKNYLNEDLGAARIKEGLNADGTLPQAPPIARSSQGPAPVQRIVRPQIATAEPSPSRPPGRAPHVAEYIPGPDAVRPAPPPRPSRIANPGAVQNLDQLKRHLPNGDEPTRTLDIRG